MIVIGSRAMNKRIELSRVGLNTDFDVLMTIEEFIKWKDDNSKFIHSLFPRSANKYKAIMNTGVGMIQYEIEIGFSGSSKLLLDNRDRVCEGFIYGKFGEKLHVLSLKYLLLTKRSHLIYPIHFEKNINDYHEMKFHLGNFELDLLMQEYFELRKKETAERVKQRTPNLNVTTEDFFSSKLPVPNYFVHDDIHEVMAHHDRPIFTMMQKDSSKAWCEKDMFFDLPHEYQVQCVQEEAYVIALERYIIPQHGSNVDDHLDCYKRAVKRICTTLTSGWFREFAIENYDLVMERYNEFFVHKFIMAALVKKSIKPLDKWELKQVPLIKAVTS